MEIWDLYDSNRKIVGEHIRGVEMPPDGMAFRTLTYIEQMKPAEIVECNYYLGQDDFIYSFH